MPTECFKSTMIKCEHDCYIYELTMRIWRQKRMKKKTTNIEYTIFVSLQLVRLSICCHANVSSAIFFFFILSLRSIGFVVFASFLHFYTQIKCNTKVQTNSSKSIGQYPFTLRYIERSEICRKRGVNSKAIIFEWIFNERKKKQQTETANQNISFVHFLHCEFSIDLFFDKNHMNFFFCIIQLIDFSISYS